MNEVKHYYIVCFSGIKRQLKKHVEHSSFLNSDIFKPEATNNPLLDEITTSLLHFKALLAFLILSKMIPIKYL